MKYTRVGLWAIALSMSLAACSITKTNINRITTEKLANGKTIKVMYKPPLDTWQCDLLTQVSKNWGMEHFNANFNRQGPAGRLKDEAISYANQYHLKTNLVQIIMPNDVSYGGVDTSSFSNATVNYYQCKILPPDSTGFLGSEIKTSSTSTS